MKTNVPHSPGLKSFPRSILAALPLLLLLCSCSSTPEIQEDAPESVDAPAALAPIDQPTPEAISLLGQPLFAPELPPDVRMKRERELQNAQYEYDRTLHDEDAIIWLGRRLAYLGRYNDAINVFSNGLAIHPDSFKLLCHRGHRYITIRKFDLAIADLEKAAALIEAVPDEIEPDGQPNRLNIPTGSSHTNIFYHLGLAHYLRGDLNEAERAYRKCIEFSQTDDMRVAASYWLYLTLRRLHNETQAAAVLRDIRTDMDIIENTSYHRLLLHFKGELTEEQLMSGSESKSTDPSVSPDVDIATLQYGIGASALLRGDVEVATILFNKVIQNSNWAAFGHIAAEAELSRAVLSAGSSIRDKRPTN